MKLENGKIVEATEDELFGEYLGHCYDDFMSFNDYMYSMKLAGVKIVDEDK